MCRMRDGAIESCVMATFWQKRACNIMFLNPTCRRHRWRDQTKPLPAVVTAGVQRRGVTVGLCPEEEMQRGGARSQFESRSDKGWQSVTEGTERLISALRRRPRATHL